jgi:hypothetical protein
MKKRRPKPTADRQTEWPPDGDGDTEYERIVAPMLRALGRMRGRKMTELAMVCYQGYMSVEVDDREFERRHKAVDPWEAGILKAVADLLTVRSGRGAMGREKIGSFFHE